MPLPTTVIYISINYPRQPQQQHLFYRKVVTSETAYRQTVNNTGSYSVAHTRCGGFLYVISKFQWLKTGKRLYLRGQNMMEKNT